MNAKERFFLKLVEAGELKVTKNGLVTNLNTGRRIGYKTNHGYIAIGWKVDGRTRHILVHRLVWLVFVGELTPGLVLNHKDGDKTNNRLRNLEEVNVSENVQHAYDTGLSFVTERSKSVTGLRSLGEKNHNAKLNAELVRKIRRFYEKKKQEGWTQRDVAARIQKKLDFMTVESIREVIKGRVWKHVR